MASESELALELASALHLDRRSASDLRRAVELDQGLRRASESEWEWAQALEWESVSVWLCCYR